VFVVGESADCRVAHRHDVGMGALPLPGGVAICLDQDASSDRALGDRSGEGRIASVEYRKPIDALFHAFEIKYGVLVELKEFEPLNF
jgi:hypothetical protein